MSETNESESQVPPVSVSLSDPKFGDLCVICSKAAIGGIPVAAAKAVGADIALPVCGACQREVSRPRRLAAICLLVGLFVLAPVAFLGALHAAGVNLQAHRESLRLPVLVLFLGPFVLAAYWAKRGRTLRGVQVCDLDPQEDLLVLAFDDPAVARRVRALNPPRPTREPE